MSKTMWKFPNEIFRDAISEDCCVFQILSWIDWRLKLPQKRKLLACFLESRRSYQISTKWHTRTDSSDFMALQIYIRRAWIDPRVPVSPPHFNCPYRCSSLQKRECSLCFSVWRICWVLKIWIFWKL